MKEKDINKEIEKTVKLSKKQTEELTRPLESTGATKVREQKKQSEPVEVQSRKKDDLTKEELFELLDAVNKDDDEEERLRLEISGNARPKNVILEKSIPTEQVRFDFFNHLMDDLNAVAPNPIDRDDVEYFLDRLEEGDDINKITREILAETNAAKISDLEKKSNIFEEIFDFLEKNFKKEKRQLQYDITEREDIDNIKKQKLIGDGIKELEKKYNFAELKDKYLGMANLDMSDAEKTELSKLLDLEKYSHLMQKEFPAKEAKRLEELLTKSKISQTWENI